MIKDEDVARYPEFSRERTADIFGTIIRVSTNLDGKIFRRSFHLTTEELTMGFKPASQLYLEYEARAEEEIEDAIDADEKPKD